MSATRSRPTRCWPGWTRPRPRRRSGRPARRFRRPRRCCIRPNRRATGPTGCWERGSGTQSDVDATTEAYITARSARDQAQAQLAKAQRSVDDTVLHAVVDAIVTDRSADAGQVVGAGQAVVTLASESAREAVFLAPDAADIDGFVGQQLSLSPLGGGQTYQAQLTEVSPVVADNGTVKVKATLADGQGRALDLGAPVVGHVTLQEPPAIRVPWTALTATAAGPAVWAVDPASMTVRLVSVTIASYTDDAVEISEGLADGDLVVGRGSQALFPGRMVARAEGDE